MKWSRLGEYFALSIQTFASSFVVMPELFNSASSLDFTVPFMILLIKLFISKLANASQMQVYLSSQDNQIQVKNTSN